MNFTEVVLCALLHALINQTPCSFPVVSNYLPSRILVCWFSFRTVKHQGCLIWALPLTGSLFYHSRCFAIYSYPWLPVLLFCTTLWSNHPKPRLGFSFFFYLWMTTITIHNETRVQHLCFQPNNVSNPFPLNRKGSLSLPVSPLQPPSFTFPLWKLILSDATELWKPWAEVLQMLCHHAKHGKKRMPRQLSDTTWEIADDALPHHRLFDFSLYLSFQLHRQTALCLPRSAGLVLMLARENSLAGKWWQGTGRSKANGRCRRETFQVQMIHTKSKQFTIWLNRPFVCMFE